MRCSVFAVAPDELANKKAAVSTAAFVQFFNAKDS